MSTEERDKLALEAYPYRVTGAVDWNLTPRTAFARGWDARGQVTPDEEVIARVLLGVDMTAQEVALIEAEGSRPWRIALAQATAILALFNEKENE